MTRFTFFSASLCAISFFLLSCNREQPAKQEPLQKKIVCYQSFSQGDTAWLSIDTAQKVITGKLKVNYVNKMQIFDGTFTGKMYGDTLKGSFDFKVNNENPARRNPMAFLKKDNKLSMGIGQFMTVMGMAQFDDRVPIDYDNSRFVLEEVSCKP